MTPDITAGSVWSRIPKRGRESNKGSFGAVLAVAGSACYRGAAALTVEGALRTGAGIVTLASVEPVMTVFEPSTASRQTCAPSTTIEREPMKQLSSIMTGAACTGSNTPPIPTPPLRCTFFPIWAHEPTVAQVSTIVPEST